MLGKTMAAALALSTLLCLAACGGEAAPGDAAEGQGGAPEAVESEPTSADPEYHFANAVRERGVLVVGAEGSNKMVYTVPDDPGLYGELAGTRDGYVPEVCRKIAEEMGVGIEFVEYGTIDELLGAVAAGDIDIAAGNWEITEERLSLYEMTDSIDVTGIAGDEIFLSTNPTSGTTIQAEGDIAHARIGSVAGSAQAENAATLYPEAEVIELATSEEALAALAAGQVDAAVFPAFDRAFADRIAQEILNGTVAQCGWTMADPDYLGIGLILMKGNEDLCQCVNGIISELLGSGWLSETFASEELQAKERGIA